MFSLNLIVDLSLSFTQKIKTNNQYFLLKTEEVIDLKAQLMAVKLCSHRTWKYAATTELEIFVKGQRFHSYRLIKLTKKCIKGSFLEIFMKEYE